PEYRVTPQPVRPELELAAEPAAAVLAAARHDQLGATLSAGLRLARRPRVLGLDVGALHVAWKIGHADAIRGVHVAQHVPANPVRAELRQGIYRDRPELEVSDLHERPQPVRPQSRRIAGLHRCAPVEPDGPQSDE